MKGKQGMDSAIASVLCVAIVGLAAPITVAIVKLVPRRKGNNPGHNPGFCTKHADIVAEVETLKALSKERQNTILDRFDRLETILDDLRK